MDENVLHTVLEEYQKLIDSDREKALEEALRIEAIAREKKSETLLAKALLLSGRIYYRGTLYEKSLEKNLEALPIFIALGLQSEEADCRNLIAVCQYKYGDFAESLKNAFESLKITRKTKNRLLESTCCNTIGNSYLHLQEFDNALDYLNLALKIKDELLDEKGRAMILINLGNVYFEKREYEHCEKYYSEALEIKQKMQDWQGILICYNNLGNLAADYHKNLQKALEYYDKSHALSIEHNFDYYTAELYYLKASLYYNFEMPEKALESLDKCSELSLENNYTHIIPNMTDLYGMVYYKIGDFQKACEYYRKSYTLVSETFKDSSNSKIEYLNVMHRVELIQQEAEFQRSINEELKTANEKLVELNNEKNEFLGIAAHDLKNPLSAISLSVAALRKLKDKYSPEQVDRKLEQIELTSMRMQDIIKNFLDINAIESGRINLNRKKINVLDILDKIISDNHVLTERKGIKLNMISDLQDVYIMGDYAGLMEVFENLFSNAIKYSPLKSEVTIKCEINEPKENVIVSFIDEGMGIKQEEMSKLFKKFSKLSTKPTAGENSTGLGLSIVKKLIESMDGEVWCESVYGEGSNFRVKFKLENS
ncbi:MAG: tetratricopeptide repeat-containing sensor histidine kinase [Bacteroidetes bacterium]|nr:tetratricopeptide repeat-containing sensor histidine kinase [Bacteroidota bacterium]